MRQPASRVRLHRSGRRREASKFRSSSGGRAGLYGPRQLDREGGRERVLAGTPALTAVGSVKIVPLSSVTL